MSEIKLLPCPFCGGEAKVCNGSNEIVGNQYLIRCKGLNCTLRPKTEWYESLDEAARHWNTRKPMERINSRLEEEIELVVTKFPLQGKYIKKTRAIDIVKEEGRFYESN